MTHAERSIMVINGERVLATDAECEAIRILSETRKGGFATVHGYIPSSNWAKEARPVQTIQFLSRFSVAKLYERRIAALTALRFDDVAPAIQKAEKLASMTDTALRELFVSRKMYEIESMEKTLAGVRDSAQRKAHDRNYIRVTDGIKVNLVSAKNDDGIMVPVLTEGLPTVASVMVMALFIKVETLTEGVRKYPNSGPAVLMGNAMTATLKRPGLDIRSLSLKPDNFNRLSIDGVGILNEGLHPDVASLLEG